ncbi:uncharacterized protein LOC112510193 [Cynara cardunculus var. scolymus]|uniref:Uncharacterized protein n=1 Tax=Cynara cardunculus var. scolymus TaxID=59895 RepID=A0A118K3H3_CYNCS|nr:uncharacterized protein LOC112510193 [Cynara cardunculus var. scolymus]KVI05953.1 hypothetical protein Ccrd_015729 [Cynara cardunculus var. scolymus]
MPKIADVKSRSRSKRKPLRDVSNGGFKPSHGNSVLKKPNPDTKQQDPVTTCGGDPLDRLLLVHSDLSALIHQIDELVVQALEQKVRNKKEIESFAQVLYEMQTSLKPWISRFKKVYSTHTTGSENQFGTSLMSKKITPSINEDTNKALDSPDIYKLDDFLVSPSPLVSWRADGAAEGGRNLFLLTPLPRPTAFSSKLKESSKLVFEKITNDVTVGPVAQKLNNGIEVKPMLSDPVATDVKSTVALEFSSPEKMVRRNDSLVVSTPYLKMSPPKSCILLEPASEYCKKTIIGTKIPTMAPVGGGRSGDSEPSSSQPSGHLAMKYPEIFGIRPITKLRNARKAVEASPNWCMSPPKTCILLEPSDDGVIQDVQTNLANVGGIQSVVSRNEVIDNTPMCKDLDTTVLRGRRAGENTLKRELWMRFEAATADVTVEQEIPKCHINKGFMDLLEEVSLDDTNSIL